MSTTREMLAEYAVWTNKILEEIIGIENDAVADTLTSAMKYSLFSGGKRLRPILAILTAEMLAGDVANAGRAGAAIELIHTYSLIHDDLPSLDNDDFRRGKPTNHKVYGTPIAIMAGDALLTYAFNVLSQLNIPADRTVKIIQLVSRGAGYSGMVGGQVLDLEAEGQEIGLEKMQKIHLAKTGELFKCSILAGAYCAEPDDREITALENFAYHLGLTFQIVDDLLDVIGDEKSLGKKVGSDQALNKATYPKLLGIERTKKAAEKAAVKAKDALNIFDERARKLQDIVDYIVVRES